MPLSTKPKMITVQISAAVHRRLKALQKKTRLAVRVLVDDAMKSYLAEMEKKQ